MRHDSPQGISIRSIREADPEEMHLLEHTKRATTIARGAVLDMLDAAVTPNTVRAPSAQLPEAASRQPRRPAQDADQRPTTDLRPRNGGMTGHCRDHGPPLRQAMRTDRIKAHSGEVLCKALIRSPSSSAMRSRMTCMFARTGASPFLSESVPLPRTRRCGATGISAPRRRSGCICKPRMIARAGRARQIERDVRPRVA